MKTAIDEALLPTSENIHATINLSERLLQKKKPRRRSYSSDFFPLPIRQGNRRRLQATGSDRGRRGGSRHGKKAE